jgi:hypothetical protein
MIKITNRKSTLNICTTVLLNTGPTLVQFFFILVYFTPILSTVWLDYFPFVTVLFLPRKFPGSTVELNCINRELPYKYSCRIFSVHSCFCVKTCSASQRTLYIGTPFSYPHVSIFSSCGFDSRQRQGSPAVSRPIHGLTQSPAHCITVTVPPGARAARAWSWLFTSS